MQEINDWGVSYSIISFFSHALKGHSKVASFQRTDDIFFTIEKVSGEVLHVLLVNEYVLGMAAVLRAQREFPEVDYIVTGTKWNGYTEEAKAYGDRNSIGIFNVGEFFGALHWTEPKKYYIRDEDGNPVYSYKNS